MIILVGVAIIAAVVSAGGWLYTRAGRIRDERPDEAADTPGEAMHYPACQGCAKALGGINIGGNLALAVIKGSLGIIGGSQALVADGIHSLADLLSSGLLVVGLRVAKRPADERHPYGYGKVEFLVAIGIYTLLLAAGGFILYDSIHMIVDKEEVNPATVTLLGALLSALGNEMMYRQSQCAGRQLQSPSIVANAAEKRGDVFSSLAVLFGILGAKLGIHFLDPAAAVLVACLILHSSFHGIWEALQGLLDTALDPELLGQVEQAALEIPGIAGLGTIRSRELGQRVWLELEVLTDGSRTLEQLESLRVQVARVAAAAVGRQGEFVVHLRADPASSSVDHGTR